MALGITPLESSLAPVCTRVRYWLQRRTKASLALVLTIVVFLSFGCASKHSAVRPQSNTCSLFSEASTDGPIHSDPPGNNVLQTIDVDSVAVQFWVPNIDYLFNQGSSPVTLDCVALGTIPDVASPRVVGSAIVGPDRKVGAETPPLLPAKEMSPLKGYVVQPQSELTELERKFGYLVLLKLAGSPASSRAASSPTNGVQVFYHDNSNHEFVATYNLQFIVRVSATE